jgi:hypothetical protein
VTFAVITQSPYPSFFSQAQESFVIQFFASASVAKSGTSISGRSGNVTTTSHPGPTFMGRGYLILATDLAMAAIIMTAPLGMARQRFLMKCRARIFPHAPIALAEGQPRRGRAPVQNPRKIKTPDRCYRYCRLTLSSDYNFCPKSGH